MYKLLAGVISIIIFAPVALFARNFVSTDAPVDTTPADMAAVPADTTPEQALEPQVEELLESPESEDIEVQPQVVKEVPVSGETSKGAQEPEDPFYTALQSFAGEVYTGQSEVITGIFVSEDFALDVVQQPQNNAAFVSEEADVVTEFALVRDFGTIGLLAHNYLAGDRFDELTVGQELYLVYGDNQFVTYSIVEVVGYRALSPHSIYSDFVSLDDPETLVAMEDLFYEIYGQDGSLVLQTCIENEGNLSWGRLFVTAVPNQSPADLAMVVDQP